MPKPKWGYNITISWPDGTGWQYFNVTRQYREAGRRVFESKLHAMAFSHVEKDIAEVSWTPADRLEESFA